MTVAGALLPERGPLPGGRPRHPPAGDHLDGGRGRGGAARGLRPRRVLRMPQGARGSEIYNIYHHKQTIVYESVTIGF